jgi:hypothetical protein
MLLFSEHQRVKSVGRILRKEVYEEHPIVIDIRDDIEVFGKQYEKRLAYYCKQKYAIYEYYVCDDVNNTDGKFKQFDDEEFITNSLRDFTKDNLVEYDDCEPVDLNKNMFDDDDDE